MSHILRNLSIRIASNPVLHITSSSRTLCKNSGRFEIVVDEMKTAESGVQRLLRARQTKWKKELIDNNNLRKRVQAVTGIWRAKPFVSRFKFDAHKDVQELKIEEMSPAVDEVDGGRSVDANKEVVPFESKVKSIQLVEKDGNKWYPKEDFSNLVVKKLIKN